MLSAGSQMHRDSPNVTTIFSPTGYNDADSALLTLRPALVRHCRTSLRSLTRKWPYTST